MAKKVNRFIVIGGGSAGEIHAEVINHLPGSKLVAVVTRNVEKGNEFADKFSCKYYKTYDEAISNEDITIASICTPSFTHCQIAADMVRAGIHVIIEKPIGIDIEKIDELIRSADKKNIKICSVFQHRFDDCVIKVKKMIDEGILGNLYYAGSQTRSFRDPGYYNNSLWRGRWGSDGGGALMIQAIHYIDLMIYLMGDIDEVYGKCGTYLHDIEVEDLGIATVKFKNGGIGIIEGTTTAYPGSYRKIDIYGEKGTLSIFNEKLVSLQLKDKSNIDDIKTSDDEMQHKQLYVSSLSRQYKDMIDAVKYDRQPVINGIEGRKAVMAILSIYQSNMKNVPVKLK